MSVASHLKSAGGISLLLACLFMTACTTTTTQSFKKVKDTEVEFSSVAVGADFGQYNKLYAADMGIYFPSDGAPSLEDQKRTRQIFRDAFVARLTDYTIAREKGPNTLEIQASLVDYRNSENVFAPDVQRELRDVARPGALLFLMEIKDSENGEVLARAGDSAMAPAFSTPDGVETDWQSVSDAAEHWAQLFHTFLDENLGN